MHLTELSSGQGVVSGRQALLEHNTRSLPRHFKLTAPRARSAMYYYDHTKDALLVTKSIALVMQRPFVHAAEAFLTGLYR